MSNYKHITDKTRVKLDGNSMTVEQQSWDKKSIVYVYLTKEEAEEIVRMFNEREGE
jgi:hypothetical protein